MTDKNDFYRRSMDLAIHNQNQARASLPICRRLFYPHLTNQERKQIYKQAETEVAEQILTETGIDPRDIMFVSICSDCEPPVFAGANLSQALDPANAPVYCHKCGKVSDRAVEWREVKE